MFSSMFYGFVRFVLDEGVDGGAVLGVIAGVSTGVDGVKGIIEGIVEIGGGDDGLLAFLGRCAED